MNRRLNRRWAGPAKARPSGRLYGGPTQGTPPHQQPIHPHVAIRQAARSAFETGPPFEEAV